MTTAVEGRPLDEAQLIQQARSGDTHAYEQLVVRYQSVALRAAYLIAGSDAEDAAQEAFVKAFYALPRFRIGAPFRPWLLRIVTNEARNRRKSATRRADLALRAERARPSGDAAPSPEAAILSKEDERALLEAVNSLPDRLRLPIAYRYILDLSEAEIAATLRIPQGTVKSRLSRGLDRLREAMGVNA